MPQIRGKVVDAQGRPVSDAMVSVIAGSVAIPEIALVADDQGGFSFSLPEGSFELRADGRKGASGTQRIDTSSGVGTVLIRIG